MLRPLAPNDRHELTLVHRSTRQPVDSVAEVSYDPVMNERVVTVGSVVINVRDYERQKVFWGAVLGSEVAQEFAPWFVWFAPQHPGGISVALQTVDDPTEGTRRLHLDTTADDVEAAKARIIELGGAHVEDREMGGFGWSVMTDPEGNEFCIAASGAH